MLSLKEFKGSELFKLNKITGGKMLASFDKVNGEIVAKDIADRTLVESGTHIWDDKKWLTKEDPDFINY